MKTSTTDARPWDTPELARLGTLIEMTGTYGTHGDKEKAFDKEHGSAPFWCDKHHGYHDDKHWGDKRWRH